MTRKTYLRGAASTVAAWANARCENARCVAHNASTAVPASPDAVVRAAATPVAIVGGLRRGRPWSIRGGRTLYPRGRACASQQPEALAKQLVVAVDRRAGVAAAAEKVPAVPGGVAARRCPGVLGRGRSSRAARREGDIDVEHARRGGDAQTDVAVTVTSRRRIRRRGRIRGLGVRGIRRTVRQRLRRQH
eukprot:356020-Chlamydomonas_euryale.AAC.1